MLSNIEWVVIDIILFNILALSPLFKFKAIDNKVMVNNSNNSINCWILIWGIIIYSVCDRTGGDYFHYREIVESIYSKNYWGTHLERPYIFLANLIGFSYELWRLLVWGTALYFYIKIIEEYGFSKFLSLWIFILIGLTDFSIVRSSLAMTVLIYGTLLIKKNRIIGVFLIVASCCFHKSIIILIPYLILLKITLNKKTIILIILSLGIIKYIISNYGWLLLPLMVNDNSKGYVIDNTNELGLAYLIQQFLFWFPSSIFIIKGIKHRYYKFNYKLRIVYNLLFYLFIIYIILCFFPINMSVFKDRIIWMMSIPVCLIISNFINSKITVQTLFILLIYLVYNNYKLLYMLYLKSLGLGV